MTFWELINSLPKEFDNQAVNLSILFSCSKLVKSGSNLILNRNKKIDFDDKDYLTKLKEYYQNNKPLSQITHEARFNGYNFIVNDHIHCPRNETELLAKTIDLLMMSNLSLVNVIDICAGTGNIGISIKLNHKYVNLTSLDVDFEAIKNIQSNLKLHHLKAKVINEDFFAFINNNKNKFDVVIMNPPYVDINVLDQSMTKYENIISFSNSKDPLKFYEVLINNLTKLVNKNHFLIGCEFGYDQKHKIKQIIKNAGYLKYTTFYKDLNNLDRYFIIYKK